VSGTHSLGISDHSLIYLIRKSNHQVIDTNYPVTRRQMKNFNDGEFLNKKKIGEKKIGVEL
jgi:hypothetical protein